jgi:4-carboxymuconolactone decarboxylase
LIEADEDYGVEKKETAPQSRQVSRHICKAVGTLPPLPAARFEFSGEVNPEFLHLSEKMRAHSFYSDVIDGKTTQLILFGMLLVEHNPIGAQAHANAARRLGASWKELHKVVELASTTGAFGPANQGSKVLKELRDKEQDQ